MTRPTAIAIGLAAVVALAGCSALFPGESDGDGELVWETVPPESAGPSPSTTTPAPVGGAPFENPRNLTDRHHRVLTEGSYRVEGLVVVYRNETTVGRQRVVVDRADDAVHYRTTVEGDPPVTIWPRKAVADEDDAPDRWADTYEIYAAGEGVWNRIEVGSETRVNRIHETGLRRVVYAEGIDVAHLSQRERLFTVLSAVPEGGLAAQVVGEGLYSVVATPDTLTRRPAFAGGTLLELHDLVLVVRSSGVLAEARLDYTVRIDGERYRVIEHVEFETGVAVERPEWVPTNGTATGTPGTETGTPSVVPKPSITHVG